MRYFKDTKRITSVKKNLSVLPLERLSFSKYRALILKQGEVR
jgi:hypothetical protein